MAEVQEERGMELKALEKEEEEEKEEKVGLE